MEEGVDKNIAFRGNFMRLFYNKMEEGISKHPYIFLALKTLNRMIKRDKDYVAFALNDYSNPRRLSIETLGNENWGKVIYCIREQGMGYGFFAEFRVLIYNLMFAEEMGFIPYVKWGSRHLYYDKDVTFTNNVFEYYFEPIKVDNLDQSKNICFSTTSQGMYIEKEYGINGYDSNADFERVMVQTIKQYIHIRSELLEDFDKDIISMLGGKRILGVHHRGTDYKRGYNGHPQMIDIEQGIMEAENMLDLYELDGIFLATDDEEILRRYKTHFGHKVKYFTDTLRSTSDKSIAFSNEKRECHHYNLGKEVLRDVYVLSKCVCLLAGRSQVSFFASVFNQCYSDKYIEYKRLDNGICSSDRYFKAKKK